MSASTTTTPEKDYLSLLPTVLIQHLSQFYLHDRDVVALHTAAASSSISRQLLPPHSHSHSQTHQQQYQYRRKGMTQFYFIYDDHYQPQYITDQNPISHHFILEHAWIAKRQGGEDGEVQRKEEKEEKGEEKKAAATSTTSIPSSSFNDGGWILRSPTSSRRLGIITRLSMRGSWLPITLSSLTTSYIDLSSTWHQIKSEPVAAAAAPIAAAGLQPLMGEMEYIMPHEIDTAMHNKKWGRHWYDGGFIPRTIEVLELDGPILMDSALSSFTHCKKLHTIEYEETHVHHLIADPSSMYPPSLRRIKYGIAHNYDEFMTPEVADIRFPQSVTDLEIGPHLFCSPTYYDNPNSVPIPSTITKLSWLSFCNHNLLKWTQFPPNLKHLIFAKDFGFNEVSDWTAPQSVEYLHWGKSFNQDLSHVVMPAALTEMRLSQYYNLSLAQVKLPKTFKKLIIEGEWCVFDAQFPDFTHTAMEIFSTPRAWNQSVETLKLSKCCHTIIFGDAFDQPVDTLLKGMKNSAALTHLQFGQDFNQPIDELMKRLTMLPLTHLEFGKLFNQPSWDVSIALPQTLKHLIFSTTGFHQSLNEVVLPTSLEVLVLGPDDQALPDMSQTQLKEFILPPKWNRPVDELKLPPTLKKLVFSHAFNRSIKELILPPSLTSLQFGPEYNGWSPALRMPDTLTELIFGTKFVSPLTDFSNTKLKSLVLPPKWNASLKDLKLPLLTFESLTFGRDFNQSMLSFTMSQSLTRLVFGEKFKDATFSQVTLPISLRHLEFHSQCGVYSHAIPRLDHLKHLQILILSAAWNRSTADLQLYHDPRGSDTASADVASSLDGLRHLTFGASFNQLFEGFRFPVTLQTLKFGTSFDRLIDQVHLPNGLTDITLGTKWNHPLDTLQLPTGLQHLRFGREFNQSLVSLRLPHLISLELDAPDVNTTAFIQIDSLMSMSLPRSFRHIVLPHLKHPRLVAVATADSMAAYQHFLRMLTLNGITIVRLQK